MLLEEGSTSLRMEDAFEDDVGELSLVFGCILSASVT